MKTAKADPFSLPALPYDLQALAPVISAHTLDYHHGKHHQFYVNTLNKLAAGTPYADMALEEIIRKTSGDTQRSGIFNNAAQMWNHTFFWHSLSPSGGGRPAGKIAGLIEASFGSYENFIEEFSQAGLTQFGSGWVWLVEDKGGLKITKTPNAVNPLAKGKKALLTVDVWEHAYYLDYQNRRGEYLKAVLENLLNWDFAEKNLAS